MPLRATPDETPGGDTLTIDPVPGTLPGTLPGAFEDGWADAKRYALVRELARGGGGRIAIAVDRKLGRRVALKRALDADGNPRLEREAVVLARLEHPSIVAIHDAGRDDTGAPFYTMKLVDGETLAARIGAAASFDDRLALLPIVTTVTEAMAYAHAQGVIHRDLKPGNVVVGAFGEVAVIDWGLAKLVDGVDVITPPMASNDAALTRDDAVVGTPSYMAPEQAAGGVVDRRADVYALGAMLYHVLSGSRPYATASAEQTLAQLLTVRPQPLDEREPRVPRDLAAIAGKAMAREPDDRYRDAGELADDLRRYQTGRLVAAHRYRPWTRAWRWLRRHQARVAIGAGAIAIACAIAAVVWAANARSAPDDPCAGVDTAVRGAWNPAVAASIEKRFLGTGVAQAAARWKAVAAELDSRGTRIADMRVAACRAARVTGVETTDTLELRMTCLDRRTDELRDLVAWLAKAERDTVVHADSGIASLGRIGDCADVARLRDVMPMPADLDKRAAIAAIQHDLDAAMTTARAGNYVEADHALPALVTRAEATGYEPVRARALFDRAQLLVLQTKTTEVLDMVQQGVTAAERAGDDRLRADILLVRLYVELNTLRHLDVAAQLADEVEAIGQRVRDDELVSSALGYVAQIDLARDKVDDAIKHAEQSLALIAEPDSRKGWSAQFRLGSTYAEAHRLADAARILEKLVASRRKVIGNADDPNLAADLGNLAVVYDRDGDKPRAIATLQQAVGILDRTLPVDAKPRLEAHTKLAVLESGLGHYAEARAELAKVLPIAEAKLGHNHASVADIVFRIAEVDEHSHDKQAALTGYRDALTRYTAANVPLWIGKTRGHVGTLLLELDRPRDALPELQAAYAAMVQLRGADSEEAAMWRGDVGRVERLLGDPKRAIADLEAALAVLDHGNDRVDRGMYRMNLAMAQWQLGDRRTALDLAAQARALLETEGPEGKDNLEDLTAWERSRK